MNALILFAATALLQDCGNPDTDQAVLYGFGMIPENPIPNQNATLWMDYDLYSTITGGHALYSYNLNGLPYNEMYDLCSQTVCPKYPGEYNDSTTQIFPDFSGKLVTRIEWFNQNDEPVLCLESIYRE